jgi:hypothetical protein
MKFKDAAGREWTWPKITTRLLTKLRDDLQIDLRELLREDSTSVALALADDERLIDVLTFLCRKQVADLSLSREEIEEVWDADTNIAARESLIEHFFCFSQGQKRASMMMARIRGE